MTKRINVTLTDAQWDALIGAVAEAAGNWEAEADDPPPYGAEIRRRLANLDRAWRKIKDGTP